MIDTGAVIPIWTSTADALMELGAKLQMKDVSFSGFGGETKGNLYRINFRLKNIIYVDMPIIAKQMDALSCHMLLPATIFEKMIYTIDDIDKKLEIRIPDNQAVRNLYEHQSSINPNMPLRGLLYFSRQYEGYINQRKLNIYGDNLVKLPFPQYIVFL